VELCALPIPPSWPQFGVELTAGWARRGWHGAIAHTASGRFAFPLDGLDLSW
jgi:hypothetical protein